MPSMKTHSGAKKRLKALSRDKVKRKKAGRRHLLKAKNRKSKLNLAQETYVKGADMKRVRHMLLL